jgi:hypothetical protein
VFKPKVYRFKSITIFESRAYNWLKQIAKARFPRLTKLVLPCFYSDDDSDDDLILPLFFLNPGLVYFRFNPRNERLCRAIEDLYNGAVKVSYFESFAEAERLKNC